MAERLTPVEQAQELLKLERLPLAALHANGLSINLYERAYALCDQALSSRSAALEEAAKEVLRAPHSWNRVEIANRIRAIAQGKQNAAPGGGSQPALIRAKESVVVVASQRVETDQILAVPVPAAPLPA